MEVEQVRHKRSTRIVGITDMMVSTVVAVVAVAEAGRPFWGYHHPHEHYLRLVFGGAVAILWIFVVALAFLLIVSTKVEENPSAALSRARIWLYASFPIIIICGTAKFGIDYLKILFAYIPLRIVFMVVVWNYTKHLSLLVDSIEDQIRLEQHRANIRLLMTLPPAARLAELSRYLQSPPEPPTPGEDQFRRFLHGIPIPGPQPQPETEMSLYWRSPPPPPPPPAVLMRPHEIEAWPGYLGYPQETGHLQEETQFGPFVQSAPEPEPQPGPSRNCRLRFGSLPGGPTYVI